MQISHEQIEAKTPTEVIWIDELIITFGIYPQEAGSVFHICISSFTICYRSRKNFTPYKTTHDIISAFSVQFYRNILLVAGM
jgi:hypothetical protein